MNMTYRFSTQKFFCAKTAPHAFNMFQMTRDYRPKKSYIVRTRSNRFDDKRYCESYRKLKLVSEKMRKISGLTVPNLVPSFDYGSAKSS